MVSFAALGSWWLKLNPCHFPAFSLWSMELFYSWKKRCNEFCPAKLTVTLKHDYSAVWMVWVMSKHVVTMGFIARDSPATGNSTTQFLNTNDLHAVVNILTLIFPRNWESLVCHLIMVLIIWLSPGRHTIS
jgi:hypothetical protein